MDNEHYGRSVMEDETEKTVETNRALARWLDALNRANPPLNPVEIVAPERS